MQNQTLHILNGQSMFDHFKKTGFLDGEMMIPFNEAMCYGKTTENIFSNDFIEKRAEVHHVTIQQYADITLKPLEPLLNGEFTNLELWFDSDMFCQMNILTILAWLDQNQHKGIITLHIVDDFFTPIEKYTLKANDYAALYKQVLIQKLMPSEITSPPLKKGVELYLNYLNPDSDLQIYIREHINTPENELVRSLLDQFKEYGLGDTQYIALIQNFRSEINR
ncbi:AraC family transcriptional regulator [Ureibacillus sp. MALMAid1270]|uniref:AraC family transcriptional regulator n=1 Tax=Ureibacillus sp. MALMAid1270 TaxID=3411629 RepID=UPI003BA6C000